MKGIIEKVDKANKKITINGKEYQIGKKVWNRENLENKLDSGIEIEYDIKGSNFDFKKVLAGSAFENTSNRNNRNNKSVKSEKFDYPYNFVRFGDKVFREKRKNGKLSGKIECSLTNMSPLFIPGSKKDKNGHSEEYFLKDKDNYIIPGSSLKGTIRTVLEAISNSCVINIEEERLEERKTAGEFNDRKYGIIKRLPTPEEDGLMVEAEVIRVSHDALYDYKVGKNEYKIGFYPMKFSHSIYQYVSQDTEKNKKVLRNLSEVNDKSDVDGVLWISAQIFKKTKEKIVVPKKQGKGYKLTFEEYKNIKYILDQRGEREKKEGKTFPISDLNIGDPIIFQNDLDNGKNLAISEIPRLRYKYSPLALLNKELHSCKKIDEACPACRIFGMTGEQEGDKKEKINSISKVFFTDAIIPINIANIQADAKLIKSLGEPHPTLTSFYLNKGDYNSKSTLRGRKFYWHHKDKINKKIESFYSSIKADKREKHNSSIQFMNYGNEFKFSIRFENMTEEELGLLLYSLELEGEMLHKVGKAKALGFGSSKVVITTFELDSTDKYSAFVVASKDANKKDFIKAFKDKFSYDSSKVKDDLVIIMGSNNNLDFSKSPFPESEIPNKPQRGLNTLNWFMNMKRKYKEGFSLPKIQDYK